MSQDNAPPAPPKRAAPKKAAKKRAAKKAAKKTVKAASSGNGAAAIDAVEDGIDAAHAFLKRQFEERPGVVVGAALTAGLLIGALIAGGRR